MKRLVAAVLALVACSRLTQTPECAQYLACAEAFDPAVARQVRGVYGPTGTCWATNAITAEACTGVCVREVENYRNDGGIDVPECQHYDAGVTEP